MLKDNISVEEMIQKKLEDIEFKYHVHIICAVEAGSRAWGFASPDSDYDVRFIYVRPLEDYLKLNPVSDVIEYQLDDIYDINGWDLQKALKLLYKSNPNIMEWCHSPIVYKSSPEFIQLQSLVQNYYSPNTLIHHYLHIAKNTYHTFIENRSMVKLKKYFYVLRPILAAKWVIKEKTIPPVLFDTLKDKMSVEPLIGHINNLLSIKMDTNETEFIEAIPELNKLLEKYMEELEFLIDNVESKDNNWNELNQFFKECLSLNSIE